MSPPLDYAIDPESEYARIRTRAAQAVGACAFAALMLGLAFGLIAGTAVRTQCVASSLKADRLAATPPAASRAVTAAGADPGDAASAGAGPRRSILHPPEQRP